MFPKHRAPQTLEASDLGNHIVGINKARQFKAIVAGCIGDVPFRDKSASLINGPITRDVILIAQCGDGDVNLFGIGLFSMGPFGIGLFEDVPWS